jgi:hypothetical protein
LKWIFRKSLQKLCHDLFSKKENGFLFELTMDVYKLVLPDIQIRINNIVELIFDIKDPGGFLTQQTNSSILNASHRSHALSTVHEVDEHDDNENDEDQRVKVDAEIPMVHDHEHDENNNVDKSVHFNPHQLKMQISNLKYEKFQLRDEFDKVYIGKMQLCNYIYFLKVYKYVTICQK